MRVTYLLVAFLAGARSFKAVERRAKPMGKGTGGVVARSVVEAAIQALALDDKIAARHAVNAVRRTFPGVPGCAMNPHVTGGSGSYDVLAGNPPALPFHPSRVMGDITVITSQRRDAYSHRHGLRLYASQRQRPVPATLYRVASKEVDAKGLADLALAEIV